VMYFVAVHESVVGRYCCKSPKLPGDNFLAVRRSDRRPPIYVVSITLPRSPVSLSSGDEVPHIFTRKSRLQPGEFLITSAKRLLQQYLPGADSCTAANSISIRSMLAVVPGVSNFIQTRVGHSARRSNAQVDCRWLCSDVGVISTGFAIRRIAQSARPTSVMLCVSVQSPAFTGLFIFQLAASPRGPISLR
jgi:hypothetical protein